MSFIIETDAGTEDSLGYLARHIGPFLFRKDAHDWGRANIKNGSWQVTEVVDPRSLRRF